MNKSASIGALVLIAVAAAGAGISYHFTLDSRLNDIEQKLQANQVALQQYQIAQDTIFSSKTEALNNLNKEVDALQSSLTPLGKATQDQTHSLDDIRKQIASLQQSQQDQQDAQKKLADCTSQIEKIKHDIQAPAPVITPISSMPSVITPVSAPAATTTAPTPVTTTMINPSAPVPVAGAPLPVAPKTDKTVVDLRPAEVSLADVTPVRVYPVAVPVDDTNR